MESPYRKILVPLDLDRGRHHRTLEVAGRLAGEDAEVILLHVIEEVAGLSRAEDPEFYGRLEASAAETLEAMRAEMAHPERVRAEVVYGSRAREILGWAEEHGVDLIVLTSHQVDPSDPRQGVATLSYGVSFFAPCSVLLVKHGAE